MLSRFPLFRVFIAYVLGVLLAGYHYIPREFFYVGVALFLLFGLFLIRVIVKKTYNHPQLLFTVWILSFLLAGILNTQSREIHTNSKQDFLEYSEDYLKVRLKEKPVEKENSFKAVTEVVFHDTTNHIAGERLLIYFQKSNSILNLFPGDELILKANIQSISPPKNPHEFDYRSYLSLLQIHNQAYVKTNEWHLYKAGSWNLRRIAVLVQQNLTSVIDGLGFPDKETNVLKALLTGYRFALSDEITATYASAGAMHVLAVSGLHVGILLLLLQFISKPMLRIKNGQIWRGIFILFGIWSYAFVTGLSPSVTSAATETQVIAHAFSINQYLGFFITL